MRILVADDDPVSLRMMERTLEKSGYEVITAGNGRDAAYLLSQADGPRLALIDWMMPELDGPGVCREVRVRPHESYVYILLLTSKQMTEDVVKGLQAGADDYLTKPCHPSELKARLHTGRRILELEDKLVVAREEMRYKATHDSLTSLWDRGSIFALLKSELFRSARESTPVSVMICDIDHFKQINDVHGHLVGDEVLQQVSTRLQAFMRQYDAVGRYGGEEFLIVLGGCTASSLRKRAEELREEICGRAFQTKSGPIFVSMSVGAVTIEQWNRSTPVEPFLKEADAALYRAKEAGRNCVVCVEQALAFNALVRVEVAGTCSLADSAGV
jgi:two-component system, cell cycle response regulator